MSGYNQGSGSGLRVDCRIVHPIDHCWRSLFILSEE